MATRQKKVNKGISLELVKTRGLLMLWRRLNRPTGCGIREFVVEHADGRLLEEFARQKPAVLWMKAQKEGQLRQVKPEGDRCDECRELLEEGDAGISTPSGKFLCQGCFDGGAD